MRILVLSNSQSGTRSRRKRAHDVVARLRAEGASVDVEAPPSAQAMKERAASATRAEHDVLLVAGGDGTLSAVVNGLVGVPRGQRPPIAVLPSGRGNDFAFELNVKSEADALRALRAGRTRHVDLGRAQAGVFLGIAGTGFDARAARRAQETPLLSGGLLYTYAVLRTLVDFRPIAARIRHDGGVYEGDITFAAVGNSRRYGGGMQITPKADLEDGQLDLCLVRPVSRPTLLLVFPRVFFGRHLSHPSVTYLTSRIVEIETEDPAEVFADGEFLQETPVRLDVLPRELEVMVPP